MSLPNSMRAIAITAPGGPEVLQLIETPVPTPGPGEILIKITAAGINRAEAQQRAGAYKAPLDASPLPGLECAGHVAALGEGVQQWAIGDSVCALLPGGGYAEYALTHQDHALPVPAGLSMLQAAGLCETLFTVWINVFDRGMLTAGETFLVHGGSSGIGTTAIQLATARGARVFTTAGSDEKCAACMALGAHQAINYKTEDFVEVVKAETDGRGVDLVLDMVGGSYLTRNLRALAVDGRLSMIAQPTGAKAEVNLAVVMARRITITGSTLRPRSISYKAEIAAALRREVWPLIEAGRLTPLIDSTFALEDAAKAHTRMETSAHIGKIVLTMD